MEAAPKPKGSRFKTTILALAPLAGLGALVFLFLSRGEQITAPIRVGIENLPIAERVSFERIVFKPAQIVAHVRNAGPTDITITGVHVNDMATRGYMSPNPTIPRLGKCVVTIPHDWVEGDPYEIRLVSSTGLFHSHIVDVATLTPVPGKRFYGVFALIGAFVGIVPVFLGMAWLPMLRRAGQKSIRFLIAFTVGLLAFLGIDALEEALELSESVAAPFQPIMLTIIAALASFAAITFLSGRMERGSTSNPGNRALVLATMIALGIGIHNFGEGLAIGAAYSLGEVSLGALLILGFTIHNTTEGIAIVAPLAETTTRWRSIVFAGLLAGVPTILGTWIGGFAYSPLMSLIFLGIGAGAIFQVLYAILGAQQGIREMILKPSFGLGVLAGFALMYGTALMIPS